LGNSVVHNKQNSLETSETETMRFSAQRMMQGGGKNPVS